MIRSSAILVNRSVVGFEQAQSRQEQDAGYDTFSNTSATYKLYILLIILPHILHQLLPLNNLHIRRQSNHKAAAGALLSTCIAVTIRNFHFGVSIPISIFKHFF